MTGCIHRITQKNFSVTKLKRLAFITAAEAEYLLALPTRFFWRGGGGNKRFKKKPLKCNVRDMTACLSLWDEKNYHKTLKHIFLLEMAEGEFSFTFIWFNQGGRDQSLHEDPPSLAYSFKQSWKSKWWSDLGFYKLVGIIHELNFVGQTLLANRQFFGTLKRTDGQCCYFSAIQPFEKILFVH